MFLRNGTMIFTNACSRIDGRVKKLIDEAETIVVGAGAGLSASAGFTYSGKRFYDNFGDFAQKYGIDDMYSGGFYPYETQEEYWAYWSRYIYLNRYCEPLKPVYELLFELVKDKNYFVITTNVDHCFQRAGFDKQRLFYTQGDYGLFQCSVPCCDKTYDNESIVKLMYAEQKNMKIPSGLIPYCPRCGAPLTMNLRCDDKFVEDDGWRLACERYERFINANKNKKVLYLELGVGYNTPAIIKFPFRRAVADNKNAFYLSINLDGDRCPENISERSLCLNGDIYSILKEVKK